ncbi:hypothetical protein C8J55DRAFT_536453 [Lentinula edodes]|uniref:Uncharacterized protein n=1 Tax=Lentinula lateritia TaxID=40482 RepID=A0A9W9DMD1_9AGAR|nr:hypothetical protein C8J55DRAFT_536453 [Lentinula edodes]
MYLNIGIKQSCLLGYDASQQDLTGGVLGVGGLNPNEIRRRAIEDPNSEFCCRLIAFLDDTITNKLPADDSVGVHVPSDDFHPCSVRGTHMVGYNDQDPDSPEAVRKDFHNLVQSCQIHKHTATCYKYCKDNSQPKECRFGLHESNVIAESVFDENTDELNLRCLDGLVNNFNETILHAIRCNMDIKFIGSGASAKAVLYYITNYITKSQLKAHVAYAALERACATDTPFTIRAKRLLQKCAYSMISQQELSAQQVNTYLLDLDDHFTSHSYKNFYWTQFEHFVECQIPSPECHSSLKAYQSVEDTFNDKDTRATCSNDTCLDGSDALHPLESDDKPNAVDEYDVDDEVGISVGTEGFLIAKASQLDDYRYRPDAVEELMMMDGAFLCQSCWITAHDPILSSNLNLVTQNNYHIPLY